MYKRFILVLLLILTLAFCFYTEETLAQFGGRGAFGQFENFIQNLTVKIGMENQEEIDNSTDGVICINALGGTHNEDFCLDVEVSSNTWTAYSNTGFDFMDFSNSWTLSSNTSNSFYYPASYTSDPCSASTSSGIFWNATDYEMCYCDNAGTDLRMDDGATACF